MGQNWRNNQHGLTLDCFCRSLPLQSSENSQGLRCWKEAIVKSEYQLFVCDTSGQHEPVASFVSDTPFPNLCVGKRFDDHGWQRLRGVGQLASEKNHIWYTQ